MTVAGCVQFRESWRVQIEYGEKYVDGGYTRKFETDVLAESMGGAIAAAVAFLNRNEKDRISPENVTGVVRSELSPYLLVPTTVEALHYPDVEVTADIADAARYRKPVESVHPHPPGCFCTDCMPTRYTNTQQPELPMTQARMQAEQAAALPLREPEHAALPTTPLISQRAIDRDQNNAQRRGFATRATTGDDEGNER
jgi:hypothetical protein